MQKSAVGSKRHDRSKNHFFLAAALGAATWLTEARLDSARSVACFTAF